MVLYGDYAYYRGTNDPVVNAAVSVCLPGSQTLAPIFDVNGNPITNPVTTDLNGYFSFYINVGQYDLYCLGTILMSISVNGVAAVPDPIVVTTVNCAVLTGNMSDTVANNRFVVRTETANGYTLFDVAPNGTGTAAAVSIYPSSDRDNTHYLRMITAAGSCQINSMFAGSSSPVPLDLYVSTGGPISNPNLRIATGGRVLVNQSTDLNPADPTLSQKAQLQVNGGIFAKAQSLTWPFPAMPNIGNIYVVGNEIGTSLMASHYIGDAFNQSGGLFSFRNRAGGGLPLAGDRLGAFAGGTIRSTAGSFSPAYMAFWAEEDFAEDGSGTMTNSGTSIRWSTIGLASTGNTVERMRITPGGNLLINTTNDNGYRLQVNGDVFVSGSFNAGAISYTDITASGNLTFTGTGQFIRGNMSDTTALNRLSLQTSVANDATVFDIIPNGTGTQSEIQLYSSATKTNCSNLRVAISSGPAVQFFSRALGSGTALPIVFGVTSAALRIHTSNNVSIGSTTDNGYKLEVTGNTNVVGNLTVTGSVTAGSLSYSSIDTSGNLTFTSTGQFIRGDMSSSTLNNRLMFQTSTLNSATYVGAVPNGTATTSAFVAMDKADAANAAGAMMAINNTQVTLGSFVSGTGTNKPVQLITGSLNVMRLFTTGNVGINTQTDDGLNALQVKGTQSIVSTGFTVPFSLPAYGLKTVGETSSLASVTSWCFNDSSINGGRFLALRSTASGGYAPNGLMLGSLAFGLSSADGTAIAIPGVIACHAEQQTSATAQGCSLRFSTTPLNATSLSLTERMRITSEGIVLVGSTTGVPVGAAKLQVTGDITATGSITAGSISYTDVSLTGNLIFASTAQKVLGDFTNVTNVPLFQSNVTNGATLVSAIPNGTSGVSGFAAFNTTDRANHAKIQIQTGPSEHSITANNLGTGTLLPIRMYMQGSSGGGITLTTSNSVLIGTTTDDTISTLQLAGTQVIRPSGFVVPLAVAAQGLRVIGNTVANSSIAIHQFLDGTGIGSTLNLIKNTTSGGYPLSGAQIGLIRFGSCDATGVITAAAGFQANAEENHSDTAKGSSLRLFTTSLATAGYAERMRIAPSGAVLINTTTDDAAHILQVNGQQILRPTTGLAWPIAAAIPATALRVMGSTSLNREITINTFQDGTVGLGSRLCMFRNTSTGAYPPSSALLGGMYFGCQHPTTGVETVTARISALAGETWTDTSRATYMSFFTVASGGVSPAECLRLQANGRIIMATTGGYTTDSGDKLQVAGTIYSQGLAMANTESAVATVLDYYLEGSFAAGSAEIVGGAAGTWEYTRVGNMVTLMIPTISGTVTADVRPTVTGIPVAIRPTSTSRVCLCRVSDQNIPQDGMVTISSAGVLTFGFSSQNLGFPGGNGSGTAVCSVTYRL